MAVTEEEQKVIDDKVIEDKRLADEEAAKNSEDKTLEGMSETQIAYVKSLRTESSDFRNKNTELNTQLKDGNTAKEALKKIEEDKLVDEGKYKELLESKDKELAEFKVDKELLGKYEVVFKRDLDEELKGLGESTVKMIQESGKPIADQLEMARAIRKESGLNSNSPASAKVGGALSDSKGEDAILKEYNAEKDFVKRGEMLAEIKIKFPKLYEQI